MMSTKLDEALLYFKRRKGFEVLFLLFRKKYESLGRFGGSAELSSFTDGEIEEIAVFMGESPHHLMRKGKLLLSSFEHRLQQTRYAGITLYELLEAYWGKPLRSKKALKLEQEAARVERLETYKMLHPDLLPWFTYLESRTSDTHWIWRLLLEPDFADEMSMMALAFAGLPARMERYPLFSQRITGNPHALDLSEPRGKLWIHLLHVMADGQGPPPSKAEALNELLLKYNLLRDDIQNFVSQANLLAYDDECEHPVWRAAADEQCVMNMPMRELIKVNRVTAAAAAGAGHAPSVYVVENSGVFSALLDAVPDASLVCTHGQFKLAGLYLLDLLAKAGHTLFYSGDFDPEGLAMAVRFKERYGEQAQLWRMSIDDFHASSPVVELGDRESKLHSLLDSELGKVAQAVKETGRAGYQEGIVTLLIEDLRNRRMFNNV
ncbi:TIGR02679 family protein [Paenibacillus sp. F411]|uniref:TIGR02679 family protein n=1 Tax=Paenibacillus sp. F411 TaxID=2820239 RepID=UPI001AAFA17B|nr:TIGR02679 family protein [Paenibacillus sp. F411]MBO2945204.1 TIGR02679 family protein [Paenibacillus sp. F411]